MSHKQVHPRSIYRTPPSFKDMAIKYPKFRQFAIQELSGRVTVNFKDPAALRALNTTLLHKDFGLDVELPPDHLVPAVPSRLNYVLWLEDLLQAAGGGGSGDETGQVHGIDIGTGASCIYSLLAAKTKGWHMLATEVDTENYKCALENVRRNNLEHLIQVKQVDAGAVLKGALSEGQQYDFCMCNPPFFSSEEEAAGGEGKSRSLARPPPRSRFTGSPSDVAVSGGEVAFVGAIVRESRELGTAVRIYSSLLGHKSSVGPVKAQLVEAGATSVVDTTYCHGRTARWYVAWTFVAGCNLRRQVAAPPRPRHPGKDKPPLRWVVPRPSDAGPHPLDLVGSKVKELLQALQMSVRGLRSNEKMQSFQVTAFENTWSNQRKKRRAATHKGAPSEYDNFAGPQSPDQPDTTGASESGVPPSCGGTKASEPDTSLPNATGALESGALASCDGTKASEPDTRLPNATGASESGVPPSCDGTKASKPDTRLPNATGALESGVPPSCDGTKASEPDTSLPNATGASESGVPPSCDGTKAIEADASLPGMNPGEAAKERAGVGEKRKLAEAIEMSKKLKTDAPGCLLRAGMAVTKSEDDIVLEMTLVEGAGGREALHQVMQYFKNNLKL